jgi:hypothetical protein
MKWGTMEEAPKNSKELSYSAHAKGMNEFLCTLQNQLNLWRDGK